MFEPSLTMTTRLNFQYLVLQESFPVSLLLFDQFEDWLVAPHLPAAALSIDASLKLQVGSVPPSVCSATEHVRDVPSEDQALQDQTGASEHFSVTSQS